MHISEGVLSAPVLMTGAGIAAIGVYAGLKRLDEENLVMAGLLAAAFFVASLVHVPVGFGNAHLLLNGLAGTLLGWAAFPVILASLTLQALLFQYGGLTTLGINTFTMGTAAVVAFYVFTYFRGHFPGKTGIGTGAFLGGFLGGFLGVALAALLTSLALAFTAEGFRAAAAALFLANIPVMLADGMITMLTVGIIARVKPEMLAAYG